MRAREEGGKRKGDKWGEQEKWGGVGGRDLKMERGGTTDPKRENTNVNIFSNKYKCDPSLHVFDLPSSVC